MNRLPCRPLTSHFALYIALNFITIMAIITICANQAHALDVTGVRFGNHPDKQRVVIELSDKADFRAFTMESPNRIIVDLPRFNFGPKNLDKPASSLISDVRHGPVSKTMSRLVLQTSEPILINAAFAMARDNSQPNRIVIDFVKTSPDTAKNVSAQTMGNLNNKDELKSDDEENNPKDIRPVNKNPVIAKLKSKPVIILDPGHGGKDSGAISVNGTFEKHIVLAIGKELRNQLEDSGQYIVKMTRDKDIFIPLHERVKYARRQNGDLFMSLHADSTPSITTVSGASVYTLSDKASDKEAEKLAERENKSDLIAGVNLANQEQDVTSILIDLTSRETMNQSRFFANTIVRDLDDGNVPVLNRSPHRSAGFAVLKALDIPSALVEMGYLSNVDDASRLNSPNEQRKIASALKASIDDYFTRVATLQGQ